MRPLHALAAMRMQHLIMKFAMAATVLLAYIIVAIENNMQLRSMQARMLGCENCWHNIARAETQMGTSAGAFFRSIIQPCACLIRAISLFFWY